MSKTGSCKSTLEKSSSIEKEMNFLLSELKLRPKPLSTATFSNSSSPRRPYSSPAAADHNNFSINVSREVSMRTSFDKLTRVCDYQVHVEKVCSVGVSDDGLWICSVSSSSQDSQSTLKMFSMTEMRLVRSVQVPEMKSLSVCLPLPDNKMILLASHSSNDICFYNIEYATLSNYVQLHRDAISCVLFNVNILITGSWDCEVKVWRCSNVNSYVINLQNDLMMTFTDHQSGVCCIDVIKNDNSQLIVGTERGEVYRWCMISGHLIQCLQVHGPGQRVNGVKFDTSTFSRIVTCGADGFLKLIDIKTGTITFSKNFGENLTCIVWNASAVDPYGEGKKAANKDNPDRSSSNPPQGLSTSLLMGCKSGQLIHYDLMSLKVKFRYSAHTDGITCMDFNVQNGVLVSGGQDRRVVVWRCS